MRFFQSIKRKLWIRNLLWGIGFLLATALFVWLTISNGFPEALGRKIISIIMLVAVLFFGFCAFIFLRSLVKNKDYDKMMDKVAEIGNVDAIGDMLSDIKKCPMAKGNLRYNDTIIFYMHGTDVTIIRPSEITGVVTKIKKSGISQSFHIWVHYEKNILKIEAKKDMMNDLAQAFLDLWDANKLSN